MIQSNENGLTLLELIVVIMIGSIIAAFGLPALMDAYGNMRLRGTARDLYSTFQKGKSEAIRLNTNVVFSFTAGAYNLDGKVGSYQVFVDNGEGTGGVANNNVRDGSEEIIASVFMPSGVSLISAPTPKSFNSRGLPSGMGSIEIRNQTRWYKISLSIAGNLRMAMSTDGVTWN